MQLVQFPESPTRAWVLASGYEHWILPHWAALWALCLTQAQHLAGSPPPGVVPHIFDCATEDADTPEGHPGNAHDGGDDIDRGYAMTENPNGDFIVGPHHANQLIGYPNLLASRYEATVLAHAAALDVEFGGLVQNIAVDPRIEPVLEREIGDLSDFRQEVRRRAAAIINSSKDVSWAKFHHHHNHTRHLIRRDGDALEREFQTRLAALLEPGEPATLEKRVSALEREVLALKGGRG